MTTISVLIEKCQVDRRYHRFVVAYSVAVVHRAVPIW